MLETLDKENLFKTEVAEPLAGDKLEAKILALTAKRTFRLSLSDATQKGQERSEGSRKSYQKGQQGVRLLILGHPVEINGQCLGWESADARISTIWGNGASIWRIDHDMRASRLPTCDVLRPDKPKTATVWSGISATVWITLMESFHSIAHATALPEVDFFSAASSAPEHPLSRLDPICFSP